MTWNFLQRVWEFCVEGKVHVLATYVEDCRSILRSYSTRYLPIITLLRVYTELASYTESVPIYLNRIMILQLDHASHEILSRMFIKFKKI